MQSWLKPFLWCLIGCRAVLPAVLTWCVFSAGRKEAALKHPCPVLCLGAALSVLLNLGALFILNELVLCTWDAGESIARLLDLAGSYPELGTQALLLLAGVVPALVFGFVLRLLFYRGGRPLLSRRRKAALLLLSTLAVTVGLIGCGLSYFGDRHLSIREVRRRASPEDLDLDAEQAAAWEGLEVCAVKVHNSGLLACTADQLWLSETEDELRACPVSDVTVPAGGDVWLLLDYNHGLELKREGGSIVYLSNDSGDLIDSYQTTETARVPEPVLSHGSGFYDAPFDLVLRAEEGFTVHYTLDCSLPDADSPVYTEPIAVYDRSAEPNQFRSIRNVRRDYLNKSVPGSTPVEKAFVVRAVAADPAGNVSDTVTGVYFVESRQDPSGWVVSLVADPEDLFGPNGIYSTGGIYDSWYEENYSAAMAEPRTNQNRNTSIWANEPQPNFRKRGRDWERPASMTLLDEGKVVLDQDVGIRVQGASACEKLLKRFSIFSRSEYSGSRLFDAPVFNNTRAHSFFLRDGILNAVSQKLAEGRNVIVSPGHTVDVYLNGEFWYTTFLWEKLSNTLVANTYGANEVFVVTVRNGTVSSDDPEQTEAYRSIVRFAKKKDLSVQENYDRFCEMIDLQSLIDALSFHVYLANLDYSENHNNFLWRVTEKEDDGFLDTRWRWGLYDMDLIWSYAKDAENPWEINGFKTTRPDAKKDVPDQRPIFAALRKNKDFCRRFVLTFMDLVNTAFRPDHVLSVLDDLGSEEEKFRNFFVNRPETAAKHLAEEFELTGTREHVTLKVSDPAAGTVKLNTITPDLSAGAWSGEYFTDYPVTVTALPEAGRVFSHWIVNGETTTGETVSLPVETGGLTIEAIFKSR